MHSLNSSMWNFGVDVPECRSHDHASVSFVLKYGSPNSGSPPDETSDRRRRRCPARLPGAGYGHRRRNAREEARVYGKVLSAEQIAASFAAGVLNASPAEGEERARLARELEQARKELADVPEPAKVFAADIQPAELHVELDNHHRTGEPRSGQVEFHGTHPPVQGQPRRHDPLPLALE